MSSPAMQVRSRLPRIAGVAVDRARLTVVPRRRTRAARMPFIALVTMVLLGGVVGLLLFNTSMQQASFAASALEDQATTLAAREQTLQMQLDALRDPQRIATAATRLGMVQACSPAFLSLGTGEVTGQPCAGTAAVPFRINPLPPGKPAALNPPAHIVYVAPPATGSTQHAQGKKHHAQAQHHQQHNSHADTGAGSRAPSGADGKKKSH
jgi:ABC-type nickel/cobalt efflux system permease component RcnA